MANEEEKKKKRQENIYSAFRLAKLLEAEKKKNKKLMEQMGK